MTFNISERTKALLARFALGLVLTEIPVLTAVLQQPSPDWRLLAIGLLGGASAAAEKYIAPQLADTLLSPVTVATPSASEVVQVTKPTA